MRDNINKVSQRGERLDSLQDKTDNLAVSAQGFRRGANRVRKQMWCTSTALECLQSPAISNLPARSAIEQGYPQLENMR